LICKACSEGYLLDAATCFSTDCTLDNCETCINAGNKFAERPLCYKCNAGYA